MLTESNFVVPHLDFQTHPCQGVHQLGAHRHGLVVCREVEITADVVRNRVNGFDPIALEQEELGFGTDVIGPAARI